MKRVTVLLLVSVLVLAALPGSVRAEILAMFNYESKPEQTARREGVAIIDVDPTSDSFGKILLDIPLPPDLVAHHIFYNKDVSKAYVTALGKSELLVLDMKRFPYRIKRAPVPDCKGGEDIVFSDDNTRWYLTCLGSANVIMGDARTDTPMKAISVPGTYPHGIAVLAGIDRMLVTNTVRPSDLGDAGETLSVVKTSTGEILAPLKLSTKASPSGVAPVEVLPLPGSNPPLSFITNMYGNTLWTARWDGARKAFEAREAFNFAPQNAGVPLEMYVNKKRDRLYVTTAKPGALHIFDLGKEPGSPKLLKTIPAAPGAHHVAFTPDERYAFVQNSLLNLPGMNDGSVTVIDLEQEKVVASMETLKKQGYNPNSIVLLPEWHHDAGH